MKIKFPFRVLLPILLLTAIGFLVMGYHPGAEDDAIYLSAIKAHLNPALFPHDAAFFQLQMRTSFFDTLMANFVQGSGIPLAWAALLWQLITIFLILLACWSIVSQIFEEETARWAGVAMVTALFTLPVAGTALFILDQYLHPRGPATALILFAISRILADKRWQAAPLLLVAFLIHPLMGALGISFSCVLSLTQSEALRVQLQQLRSRWIPEGATPIAMTIPFGWVFDPPSQTWLDAFHRGHAFRLYQWEWYEWLGAIAPLFLFWIVVQLARRRGENKLANFATAICFYGLFQLAVAMVIQGPEAPIGLSTLEPMRYLHLIYIFLALLGGAYLGRYLLKASLWRWAIFLLIVNGGMFLGQRELFASSTHVELPTTPHTNAWLQAFDWIRQSTPVDAYFALGPRYMAAPDEDHHSFRALAERSQLADSVKDTSVVTKVPELAPIWKEQIDAQAGWNQFKLNDFERLKSEFGVDWVVVHSPATAGLVCRWHNESLSVCMIP
jgi:hypothetical protein